jgi:alanine racemase
MGVPVEEAGALAALVVATPELVLDGLWTHLAVAEGGGAEDREFTARQLRRFEDVRRRLESAGIRAPRHHAANSAAALAWPEARYDLVRVGLALYGELPSPEVAAALAEVAPGEHLAPVLALKARVTAVRQLAAGERPSYGRRRPLPARATVATVPLGYADGVPRRYFEVGGEVLIDGRRRPLAGTVTMDQLLVDCGPESLVGPGDEVVLIGRQGDEEITAGEWAERLGTISYEVLTGIGPRVPRVVRADAGTGAQARGRPREKQRGGERP